MKQVAAVRFHRNHRLMLEIFDKNSHLNTRAVVTKERLNTLMKQVQSLQQHQVSVLHTVMSILDFVKVYVFS